MLSGYILTVRFFASILVLMTSTIDLSKFNLRTMLDSVSAETVASFLHEGIVIEDRSQ